MSLAYRLPASIIWSLPTRGGWIEMVKMKRQPKLCYRPSPHGEGGLKSAVTNPEPSSGGSLPTRGGWIEMSKTSP